MINSKSFTLTEILIAIVLMGVIILAVTSVDITSRRFFGTASDESWIQDEAKIAMEHMVKNIQLGIGDMTNSRNMGEDPDDPSGCSRGFYILDGSGNLTDSGDRIQVKQDDLANPNGKYDSGEPIIEYKYVEDDNLNNLYDYIRFYPDATVADPDDPGNFEVLAGGIVQDAIFTFDNSNSAVANQVTVTITVRREPGVNPSLDNPQTILTSNVILRAMSTN